MSLLYTVAAFIVALGVLIVVHEYGHYLVARLCGVKVLRFSVGFGRPLATWRIGRDRTEWVVAAIPFGGYVKMLDEREAPVPAQEAHRAFNRQGVFRRVLIVAAGPVFNFVFAIAVYAGLFMTGLPEAKPLLDAPAASTPAQAAGIRRGDLVRAVDGEPIETWQALRWRILQAALQRERAMLEVVDERDRIEERALDLTAFPAQEVEGDVLERVGLRLFRPVLEPVLGNILGGSAAQAAGLRRGDRVTHVDGKAVDTWSALVREVRARPGKPTRLGIERDGARFDLEVTPEEARGAGVVYGRIGAGPEIPAAHAERISIEIRYGPLQSLRHAVAKTWDIAVFSLRMLGKMVLGQVSWKNLSGPVTIADFAGQSAQLGWIPYLIYLALISISLGVLNLLPIPPLDGGHLLFYVIEVLKGSPASERVIDFGHRVGIALLLRVMVFAFYNDLTRLFAG